MFKGLGTWLLSVQALKQEIYTIPFKAQGILQMRDAGKI